MSVIDEYIARGGMIGYAEKVLEEELIKSQSDEDHPLGPAVRAFNEGDQEKGEKLFLSALKSAPEGSRLNLIFVTFCLIPNAQEAFKYTVKNFDDPKISENIPLEIIKWAGIELGLREAKAAGGRKKGKEAKERVIAAWEAYSRKDLGVPAFAEAYFTKMGGETDANGNKVKSNVPSRRKIEEYIRDHKKQKNSTSF